MFASSIAFWAAKEAKSEVVYASFAYRLSEIPVIDLNFSIITVLSAEKL